MPQISSEVAPCVLGKHLWATRKQISCCSDHSYLRIILIYGSHDHHLPVCLGQNTLLFKMQKVICD